MHMLIMVLDDTTRLNDVLAAWKEAGVKGVTILESTGVNRVMTRSEPTAMRLGFGQLFGSSRVGHNTLFAVVDSLAVADAAANATEAVLGDLSQPHTGLIFAVPVAQTWGLPDENSIAPATS